MKREQLTGREAVLFLSRSESIHPLAVNCIIFTGCRKGGEAVKICVNGKDTELTEEIQLSRWIEERQLNPLTLLIELNGQILVSADWEKVILRPGDQLELLQFVGGG